MPNAINQFLDLSRFTEISLPGITLSAVLDVAVLSFILYKIILHIKQNRAGIIFRGIIILLLIIGGAYLLNLRAISWLISNMFSVAIIALVVIYQSELRKLLERIGKSTATGLFPNFELVIDLDERTIDAVITASTLLSRNRTGGLMVIEREVPLGDLMEHGIPIDAVVTAELLINIFEDKTPLHDGAVIIRNNRVTAATCLLPLTKNELSHDLGTRHRAAVGASEVSDAYVVVISEETGRISIAHEGRLYRNVSADEMSEMLSQDKRSYKSAKGKRGRKA